MARRSERLQEKWSKLFVMPDRSDVWGRIPNTNKTNMRVRLPPKQSVKNFTREAQRYNQDEIDIFLEEITPSLEDFVASDNTPSSHSSISSCESDERLHPVNDSLPGDRPNSQSLSPDRAQRESQSPLQKADDSQLTPPRNQLSQASESINVRLPGVPRKVLKRRRVMSDSATSIGSDDDDSTNHGRRRKRKDKASRRVRVSLNSSEDNSQEQKPMTSLTSKNIPMDPACHENNAAYGREDHKNIFSDKGDKECNQDVKSRRHGGALVASLNDDDVTVKSNDVTSSCDDVTSSSSDYQSHGSNRLWRPKSLTSWQPERPRNWRQCHQPSALFCYEDDEKYMKKPALIHSMSDSSDSADASWRTSDDDKYSDYYPATPDDGLLYYDKDCQIASFCEPYASDLNRPMEADQTERGEPIRCAALDRSIEIEQSTSGSPPTNTIMRPARFLCTETTVYDNNDIDFDNW